MTRTRKTAGAVLTVIVSLLVGIGGSALALQTLSNNEMGQVSGRDAIYIGIGEGFPFHGGANEIKLEFDQSNWLLEFIDRPDDSSDSPSATSGYPTYSYDPYQDDVALKFCNLESDGTLGPAQILVPIKLLLDFDTTTTNSKPLLDIELYTEYTSWPSDPEPDFVFDETILRQNTNTAWYNDTTWQEGFQLHVDGITFLSYPYHDVDDVGTVADGLSQTYAAADISQRSPAMHLKLGSDNTEQGLVGELGMKLHLPGINFYSATTNSAIRREFGLRGIILAGEISQPFSDEFSYDISQMDFDGEAVLGVADAAGPPTPHNDTFDNDNFDGNVTSNYFPLTLSVVASDLGYGETHGYIVIEACGGWAQTDGERLRAVTYPVSNTADTPGPHPYYANGSSMRTHYHEYLLGDIRVGEVYSRLDRGSGLETVNLGEQAAVISDINIPYLKQVICVDERLDDILDDAYGTFSDAHGDHNLTLIDNTCMNTGQPDVFFGGTAGHTTGNAAQTQNHTNGQDDRVTAPPTSVHFSAQQGVWYTPRTVGGNIWLP